MGNARATITLDLQGEDPLLLAEGLFLFLNRTFLQTKSLEIHIPGRKFQKFPGSIDGELFWARDGLPPQLTGEEKILNAGFTTLEEDGEFLNIQRDISQIKKTLRSFLDESLCLGPEGSGDVYLNFWGLAKILYRLENAEICSGFVLREILAGRLEPILRVSSTFGIHPAPFFCLNFRTSSFVWSPYLPSYDWNKGEWIEKQDLVLETENAVLFAEHIRNFLIEYPTVRFEWTIEQEHSPDLKGFLPRELETRLGSQNVVRNATSLR